MGIVKSTDLNVKGCLPLLTTTLVPVTAVTTKSVKTPLLMGTS